MSIIDIFDLVMLIIVIFFAIKGVFRGFFAELFSLIGVIAGVYFGLKYAGTGAGIILRYFPAVSDVMAKIIAIALVFFAVCVVCAIIGKICTGVLSLVSLSALDSMCGLIVGCAKGVAIVIVIVTLLTRMQSFMPGVELSKSRAVYIVNAIMPDVERYLDMVFPKQIV